MATPVLEARDVRKAFFGNPVLKGVSIALEPGRVHALLGENGAGKSTLINILSGALAPDSGGVLVDGVALPLTPVVARRHGIAVVQQELSLTTHLSIAENIGLGAFPRRFGLVDYGALARSARALCERVGLDEDIARPVGDLSLGRRQLVEIAKALYRNPRVLILDEPTSSLSAHETRTLIGLVTALKRQGTAILYISHRLAEVMEICDYVTVLKDGSRTADRSLDGVDAAALVRLMVGRDPGDLFPTWRPTAEQQPAIAVRGFAAGRVRGVDLDLRAGEVLGIGGLVGQGQEDLLLGLYGAIPAAATTAQFGGRDGLPGSVTAANSCGLAYIPADRKREGVHLVHAIGSNMLLPGLARGAGWAWRYPAPESTQIRALAARFGIKGDLGRAAQALSGGNQQKVALAKWMPLDPKILLLNDPTRGVDIETKRDIYTMLRGFAAEGRAVMLASSDTPELVHLCDRVAVMRDGRVVAVLAGPEISEERIVALAMAADDVRSAA
ncbi:sugar ABC transporter ATP-binding protein [Lichenifustis flavocetrariae]|uniref:Sugar ABC transporter ATP-binding protein n=1 Tax=Lichenifustis flavocetrariae TaxID=2949735 RepID=A0AA41Z0Y8_9HYPH|nr:sugar ABC transporter ATP-binding protein [Lichenifustis flavocetrariae]MCW6510942.1 sugar ABC transporter ATP-binding protein [Lichenifustis flavocetrariae]